MIRKIRGNDIFNSPFSVFLFCDDALGSNIGIVLTEPGAGQGRIELNEQKTWGNWDTTDRFWQEQIWASDVTGFAWSPSLRYLYVSTSGVYGDGGVFKLDLRERSYRRLIPGDDVEYRNKLKEMVYYTQIQSVNIKTGKISVSIHQHSPTKALIANEMFEFE